MSAIHTKKKSGSIFCTFFFLLFVVMVSTSTAKTYHLKYSTSYAPFEPPAVYARKTIEAIEQKTNGQVKIQIFEGGALGGPHEQLGLATSGAVDLIGLQIDQYSQALPLHQITNTEQVCSGSEGLENMADLIHRNPDTQKILYEEQDKNNIRILYPYVNGPTGITSKVPAHSINDLKGKRVNVISGLQRPLFEEIGWLPVNVVIPELYEALSRGVIDAIFMATAANVPLKWYEIGKYHLALEEHTIISAPLAFNLKTWNSLPKDIQEAIQEAAYETAKWTAEATDGAVKMTYAKFEEVGAEVVHLPKAESDEFFKVYFKHIDQHYMEVCEKAGVADKCKNILDNYWTKMRWGNWK